MEDFGGKMKNRLKNRNFWYTAVFLFIFSFVVFFGKNLVRAADVPNIITYQGKLLVNGAAATTTQSMKFVLYNSLSGGTALYTASGTLPTTSSISVTLSSGFFTVNFGDTGTNSLDPDIFKNNSAVYLEVTIGGETLTPRKRLTAASYAFNSKYLNGVSATATPQGSAYIPVSDSVGNFNFNGVTSTALTVSGSSTLATTTISSSTIGYLNVSNNTNISGLLSVTGNSSFGTITAGTWNGNAISATYGGTGQNSSAWSGFVKVTAGTWATSTISTSDLSNASALAFLSNNQSFTGNNTFSATSTFASTTFNGYVGIGTTTPQSGLHLYDRTLLVDNPVNPIVVGSVVSTTVLNQLSSLSISGKYAFVANQLSGISVIDISNKTNPTIVSNFNNPATMNTGPFNLSVSGKYAYTVGGLGYFNVVDVSDPKNLSMVGSVESSAFNDQGVVAISGKYAYVSSQASSSLIILDISNPASPSIVGSVSSSLYLDGAFGLTVSGRYVYVASYNSDSLTVIDVSNPNSPIIVGSITSLSLDYARNVYVSGRYAYVTGQSANLLVVIDVQNPFSPTIVGSIGDSVNLPNPFGVEVSGKYAYVTCLGGVDGVEKLSVIDVSDVTSPRIIASLTNALIDNPLFLKVVGKYAYIAGFLSSAFVVVDLKGADISSADIGSLSTNILTITENVDIGNNLFIRNSLNVGAGGLLSNGALAISVSSTVSTNTIFSAGTNTTSSILAVNADGTVTIKNLTVSGPTSLATTTISSSTIGSLNVTNNTIIGGTLSVTGNSYFGTVASGTWNGNAISATYGGTGQNSSAWSGFVKVTAGTWATSTISTSDLSDVSSLALLSNNQTFTGTNTFSATSTFATTTFNGYVGIGSSTPNYNLVVNGTSYFTGASTFTNTFTNEGIVGSPVHKGSLANGAGGALLNSPMSVVVLGNYAYVASFSSNALEIVNISNPSSPSHVGSISNGAGGALLNGPRAVAVSGNYAYVVSYTPGALEVVNISDPSNPFHAGSISDNEGGASLAGAQSIQVSGKYAYIASSNYVEVVDISNPSKPVHVNSVSIVGSYALRLSGNYLYVLYNSSGMKVRAIDISDPSNPVLKGTTATLGALVGNSIFVSGNYAYVGLADSALKVVDISNPNSLSDVGTLSATGVIYSLYVSGKYAYAATESTDRVQVFDVSDPTNPVLKGALTNGSGGALLNSPRSIFVSGNYAYVVSFDSDALEIVDISGSVISNSEIGTAKISELSVVGNSDFNGNVTIKGGLNVGVSGLSLNGDFGMYTSSTNKLSFSTTTLFQTSVTSTAGNAFIFDAANFSGSSGSSLLSVRAGNVEKFSLLDTGFVGVGTSAPQQKLHVYDGTLLVDSPVNPTLASTVSFPTSVEDVYVSGKYAYVAAGADGMAIVDVSNPFSPTTTGYLSTASTSNEIYVAGKYAYIVENGGNFQIFDISNASSPTLVDTYVAGDTALVGSALYVSGRYAYTGFSNGASSKLYIFDISDPSNIQLAGQENLFDSANSIYVSGKYLYLANGYTGGLKVFDISVPSSPNNVGTKATNGTAAGIYVSGRYAYLADLTWDLGVFDISNPSTPTTSGYINSSVTSSNVFVSGKYAYVTIEDEGLKIFDISSSTNPVYTGIYDTVGTAKSVFVSGKYVYIADGSNGLVILDIKGADVSSANIGNVASNNLTVWENIDVGNNLNVRSSLNVGTGGLMLNGDFAMSNATNNYLNFSTTTLFSSSIPSSSLNAFIFDAKNTPTSSSQYLLSIRAAGTPVFSVSSNGNVHALGTLNASSATVGTPGTPGDLAERVDISLDDSVEPGDVVVVDPNSIDTYRRSSGEYSETVAGVISTNPTIVVGNGKTENTALMAMVGRVPIKVSTENGTIRKGDLLVTASAPGYAMRYDSTKDESAKTISVVGLALEDLENNGTGKIMGLVKTGWINNSTAALSVMKNDLKKMATAQGVALGSSQNLNIQNVNGNLTYGGGDLNLQGYELLNVASVSGKNNKWFIDEQGRFITRLSTSQGDKDMYAIQSPNSEFVFSSSSQMVSGEAKIVFDQYVQEVIDQEQPIKINITLTSGEGKGIYVSEKSAQGFVVKELDNGTSNATFDWMVVATRKSDNQGSVDEIINNVQSENPGAGLNSNTENIQSSSSIFSNVGSSTSTSTENSGSTTESGNSATTDPAPSPASEGSSVIPPSESVPSPAPETVSTPEPSPAPAADPAPSASPTEAPTAQ